MLGNYLQQTTSADDIFRCIFFSALWGLMKSSNHLLTVKQRQNIEAYLFLFFLIDSLRPSQQFFSQVETGLPGLN